MHNKLAIRLIVSMTILSSSLAGCTPTDKGPTFDPSTESRLRSASTTNSTAPPCTIDAVVSDSLRDRRVVAGRADTVFVGKVNRLTGVGGSQTDQRVSYFEVENKLDLKNAILQGYVVQQLGSNENGQTCIANGDPLLQPGQWYLFATAFNQNTGKHEIIAPHYGNVHLKPIDVTELQSGREPAIVTQMRDAIANQIR